MLGSVVRLSCGEIEYFARFNSPTSGSPAVIYILQVKSGRLFTTMQRHRSLKACVLSSPFTAAIIRSRINTAGIGRRNSPSTTLSSSIRFKFRLPRLRQGTTAEVNLSGTSLPYLDVLSTSKQACMYIHGPKILRNKNICLSNQWFIRNMFLITYHSFATRV